METTPSQLLIPGEEFAPPAVIPAHKTSITEILEAAVRGGITGENIAVVKEILAMRRDEDNHQNKVAFNAAFFRLKQEIAKMEFYADKSAKDRSGNSMYTYCSETEIAENLEPVLSRHGFALMFGQSTEDGRVTAELTLIHEQGHEEKRTYSVRTGATNAAKDATQADTGSTTSAWRHLLIKFFGLKSRIREEGDARNEGEPITRDQAQVLREMVKETAADEVRFLAFAGAATYEEIRSNRYAELFAKLNTKRR